MRPRDTLFQNKMAKSFLLTYLIALVVFGVDARRNIAVLKCGNSRM